MALTTFTLPTESARDPRAPRDSGDAAFFAGYSWCLNPILTLDDQVVRLGEELHRIAGLAPGSRRDGRRGGMDRPRRRVPSRSSAPARAGAGPPAADS